MCQPPTAAQVSAPPPTTTTGEKTGRWTDEEHTRFLHGLELFGKKWTKVADVVGSRTTVQVRSHAQKYFQKLEKDRAQPSGSGGRGRERREARLSWSASHASTTSCLLIMDRGGWLVAPSQQQHASTTSWPRRLV